MAQRIMIFQQACSAESKIKGLKKFGRDLFELDIKAIDRPLPPVLDNSEGYLPHTIRADLVLDFLKHPDLSHDLCGICEKQQIPVVASGKKLRCRWALTPPT